ncbi:gluconokinase [Bowmanella dokdonensis]|uniref:Gluconokinase n=1 Tax=Bowmanella dokdonensis TaxID=751969 RepID=A0A939DN63_9ALTE|nr:gluconokinase, GntK/IdnK-type [Bowmanella dokdonensis]MBN7825654.1 AAA family ATPase [Bowmanella dokdonensis]
MAEAPRLLVLMGVSGSGKTTLARQLAGELGFAFMEADDFHSVQAKNQMARGQPLDDGLREPWLTAMCSHLQQNPIPTVLAYSGLRRRHRQRFREVGFDTRFIWLHGQFDLIKRRLKSREGHYMPASLLTSQFRDLELPQAEPDILMLDIQHRPAQLLSRALAAISVLWPVKTERS